MIQQLLKSVENKDKVNGEAGRARVERRNDGNRFTAYSEQNSWKSPVTQNALKRQGSFPETPAFNQRLSDLGLNIEEVKDEVEGQYEQSEKLSQVLSVNQMAEQQQNPMILSNIVNTDRHNGADRLSLLRMRNTISELKQAHFDLGEVVEDERRIMEGFRERICMEIQDFVLGVVLKNYGRECGGDQDTEGLRSKLQNTENNYQRALIQIEELKFIIEKQPKSRGSGILQSKIDGGICASCLSLEQRVMNLTEEMAQSEREIEKLMMENEGLQESIFDMEQKIIGVDLEVQKKLKEKMKNMPEYYKGGSPLPKVNEEEVKELKEEIGALQQRCMTYQQKLFMAGEIQNRLAVIEEKERDFIKREQVLKQAQINNEEQKQANYQRQHQILEAEQNLSKKIADLRQKEAELSSWQTDLIRKSNETRPPLNLNNLQHQQAGFPLGSHDDLHHSRQVSLRSFGKSHHHQIEDHDARMSPRRNYTQQELEAFDPKKQLQKMQGRNDSKGMKGYESRKNDVGYGSRGMLNQQDSRGRNYKLINSSYYNEAKEPSPYRTLNEQRSRGHYGMSHHPSGQFRETSKNSRHSAVKSISHRYTMQSPSVRPRGETQQVTGISSKLQKLREELKKEIDSIK